MALSIDWRLSMMLCIIAGIPGRWLPGVQAEELQVHAARDVADMVVCLTLFLMLMGIVMGYCFLRRILRVTGRGMHW